MRSEFSIGSSFQNTCNQAKEYENNQAAQMGACHILPYNLPSKKVLCYSRKQVFFTMQE
jgi:hypothetical protein